MPMPDNFLFCCFHYDNAAERGVHAADYELNYDGKPYEGTHTCAHHIPQMIDDSPHMTLSRLSFDQVWPEQMPDNWEPSYVIGHPYEKEKAWQWHNLPDATRKRFYSESRVAALDWYNERVAKPEVKNDVQAC